MTTVAAVSDLHGDLPNVADLPEADVLVIAGDVCPLTNHSVVFQTWWLETVFRPWLDKIPMLVVGVAGNHDFAAEAQGGYEKMRSLPWAYLEGEGTRLAGLDVYGSPFSNQFGFWAFMDYEANLAEHWEGIPSGLDILVVHGPAYQLLDCVNNNWGDAARDKNVGSKSLRERLSIVKPKLFVCGHVHEGYGQTTLGDTIVVNACYNDDGYSPAKNPIQVVEL